MSAGVGGEDELGVDPTMLDTVAVRNGVDTALAPRERGLKSIRWVCQSCGWENTVPMPGFAGSLIGGTHRHYPDGEGGCGPLVGYLAQGAEEELVMDVHRSDYDEVIRHERITINLTRRDAEDLLRDLKVLNGPPPANGGVWNVPVAGVLQVLLHDQVYPRSGGPQEAEDA